MPRDGLLCLQRQRQPTPISCRPWSSSSPGRGGSAAESPHDSKVETGGLRLSPCRKNVAARNENRETDGISARKRGSWTPFPGRKTKGPHDFEAKSGCLKSRDSLTQGRSQPVSTFGSGCLFPHPHGKKRRTEAARPPSESLISGLSPASHPSFRAGSAARRGTSHGPRIRTRRIASSPSGETRSVGLSSIATLPTRQPSRPTSPFHLRTGRESST